MSATIDWRSDQFRQKVRLQLDEALSKHPTRFNKTTEEIETSMYTAAKSKEEYLGFVQSVMKKVYSKQLLQQQQRMNQPMNQQQMQQQQQQQPQPQQQGLMRPPNQVQGMQMRHYQNQPMPRGPPSDSPGNISSMQSPSGGMIGFSPERMPHPSPGSQFYSRQQMIRAPQQPQSVPQAQPNQPQLTMPDSTYVNTPQGSFIPSLSPAHPSNSPQVSSMSPALRTPGSVSVAHSPAGAVPSPQTIQNTDNHAQSEEMMYMEKLKQLQKYIEPLSRMINKQEKNSKDLSKMKSLRDILIDSNKRLAMPTLLKCEKVLQNWLDDKPAPTPPPFRPDQHMCQPILDAVASAIKSPMLNHTLKRTFGPALQVIHGDYDVPESCSSKKARIRGSSDDSDRGSDLHSQVKVPNVIQGEIARLGSKFKVTVDQSQSSNYGKLHLICRLVDPSLPSVPPIRILVPNTYPKEGPEWYRSDSDESSENESENSTTNFGKKSIRAEFLSLLKPKMEAHIRHAVDYNESISAILTTWQRSIKETVASQKRENTSRFRVAATS